MNTEKRHDLFKRVLIIRNAQEGDLPQLARNAAVENHEVYNPTLVMQKDDKLVGWIGINPLPLVFCWAGKEMNAEDTVRTIGAMEDAIRLRGGNQVCLPCDPKSPLLPYMEKFGYTKLMDCILYVRKV